MPNKMAMKILIKIDLKRKTAIYTRLQAWEEMQKICTSKSLMGRKKGFNLFKQDTPSNKDHLSKEQTW